MKSLPRLSLPFALAAAAVSGALFLGACSETNTSSGPEGSGSSAPDAPSAEPAGEAAAVDLNGSNFDETIASNSVVVVDFWAEWCGPCKIIEPAVMQAAKDYAGKAVVGRVDVDSNEALSQKYQISAIPCLIYFKDGKEVDRLVGVPSPRSEITEKLDKLIGG